jgi:hypothetical protein
LFYNKSLFSNIIRTKVFRTKVVRAKVLAHFAISARDDEEFEDGGGSDSAARKMNDPTPWITKTGLDGTKTFFFAVANFL